MEYKQYDIFFSYVHKEKDLADKIVKALVDLGLDVWLDENEVQDFQSIICNLTLGLSHSRALIALYSKTYPNSRYCQWEFTSAFLAGQREGDPRRRIMVLNPEEGYEHIMPSEFQDALFKKVPNNLDEKASNEIAESVKEYVSSISTTIGQINTFDKPPWYGRNGIFYSHFVGRLKSMWELHTKLNSYENIIVAGGTALVHGMGGIGKSLLVEEYAMRYGAAYPGGVYWISASEVNINDPDVVLERQLRSIALAIGIKFTNFESMQGKEILPFIAGEIKRFLIAQEVPSLWIVDDVPNGVNTEKLRSWFAPHHNAKTLVTTRSTEYNFAERISLDVLNKEDAYILVISRNQPSDEKEEAAAWEIVELLGCHALAVDIAATAVKFQSFSELLEALKNPNQDELDLAAELAEQLPNGHERSIATTFMKSINNISEDGKDLLIIASVLAQAPISIKLVQGIFEIKYGIEGNEVRRRTLRAIGELDAHSLITVGEGNETFEIHALISRTIHYHHICGDEETINAFENVILNALILAIRDYVGDISLHDQIRVEITHAEKFLNKINSPLKAALAQQVADYYHTGSNFNSAITLYKTLIPYMESELPDEVETILTMKNDYASSLRGKGNYDEAKSLLREILESHKKYYGPEHSNTIIVSSNLAGTLGDLNDYDEAIQLYEKVIELIIKLEGEESYNAIVMQNNLARALRERYHQNRQKSDLEKSRKIYLNLQKRLNTMTDHENIFSIKNAVKNGLGIVYLEEEDLLNAKKYLEEALISYKSVAGIYHRTTNEIAMNLFTVLVEMGDKTAADYILNEYLLWLIDTNPNELSGSQNEIRENIENIFN